MGCDWYADDEGVFHAEARFLYGTVVTVRLVNLEPKEEIYAHDVNLEDWDSAVDFSLIRGTER